MTDRDIAIAILLELARCKPQTFSLMDFYDDDQEIIDAIQERLGPPSRMALIKRMRVVVRRLVNFGVLYSRMQGTSKEYIDEPAKQMNYSLDSTKAPRLAPDLFPHYRPMVAPEIEAAFLVRHAYPREKCAS